MARLIPSEVKDRDGWAQDVLAAFDANGLWPDAPSVCSALAVIEQESGYDPNPAVPGLAAIVERELEGRAEKRVGFLAKPALDELLSGKAPETTESFRVRLRKVRTEGELDKLFRDILDFYRARYPNAYQAVDIGSALFGQGSLAELNPVTTAGSMQVKVDFSLELAKKQKREVCCVRDELYTRAGGVHYGIARLLGYAAAYDAPLYRFADYNAGVYASRNAALQAQLAALTGRKLTPDGDLLAYDKRGDPSPDDSRTLQALLSFGRAHELSEWRVRRDARREKERDLEETDTWAAVKRAYREKTGREPAYAQVPDVAIHSPKMRRDRSTAWFARAVDARFQKCMARLAAAR